MMKDRRVFFVFELFLMSFLLGSCGGRGCHDDIVACETVASGNIMFYKGGTGIVFKRSYIRRDDGRNNLYVNNGEVLFAGAGRNGCEVIEIISKEGRLIVERKEGVPAEKKGCIVVYTPEFVYVLDYERKVFGKYIRGLMAQKPGRAKGTV